MIFRPSCSLIKPHCSPIKPRPRGTRMAVEAFGYGACEQLAVTSPRRQFKIHSDVGGRQQLQIQIC